MAFTQPPLPYAEDALTPHVSAETLQYHYGKHHKAYVDKANELTAGTPLADLAAVEVIRRSHVEGNTKVFNQAAQAWNHEFLWQSLSPNGGGAPAGELAAAIDRDLGGMAAFEADFTAQATGHFGSGWMWLVSDGGTLKLYSGHDADNPLVRDGHVPLLTLDLWEHAYYVDYRNKRPDYVKAFLANLVNWDFAAKNLAAA